MRELSLLVLCLEIWTEILERRNEGISPDWLVIDTFEVSLCITVSVVGITKQVDWQSNLRFSISLKYFAGLVVV